MLTVPSVTSLALALSVHVGIARDERDAERVVVFRFGR